MFRKQKREPHPLNLNLPQPVWFVLIEVEGHRKLGSTLDRGVESTGTGVRTSVSNRGRAGLARCVSADTGTVAAVHAAGTTARKSGMSLRTSIEQ